MICSSLNRLFLTTPPRTLAGHRKWRSHISAGLIFGVQVNGYSLAGLLGILNSELFQWLFSTRFFDYEIKPVYLRSAPLADSNDSALVALVDEIIRLNETLALVRTGHERTALKRQIEVTDHEIDKQVYRLYGVTEDEVAIVESSRS